MVINRFEGGGQFTSMQAMADSKLATWSPMEEHAKSLEADLPIVQQLQQSEHNRIIWSNSEDTLFMHRGSPKTANLNEQVHVTTWWARYRKPGDEVACSFHILFYAILKCCLAILRVVCHLTRLSGWHRAQLLIGCQIQLPVLGPSQWPINLCPIDCIIQAR